MEAFLRRHVEPEQVRAMREPPADKVTSLLGLIAKARQAASGDS